MRVLPASIEIIVGMQRYFESAHYLCAPDFGSVAQLVEQWTENPCVDGSIPPRTTKIAKPLSFLGGFFTSEPLAKRNFAPWLPSLNAPTAAIGARTPTAAPRAALRATYTVPLLTKTIRNDLKHLKCLLWNGTPTPRFPRGSEASSTPERH